MAVLGFSYISQRMRAEFVSHFDYQRWLNNLSSGDYVAVQHMPQPGKWWRDEIQELWQFEVCRVTAPGRLDTTGNSYPHKADGKLCYWNSDRDWGDVFPARVVPLHLLPQAPKKLGETIAANFPLHEPLFAGAMRHVFFVPYGLSHAPHRISQVLPYSYQVDVDNGTLVHAFHACDYFDGDAVFFMEQLGLSCVGINHLYSCRVSE